MEFRQGGEREGKEREGGERKVPTALTFLESAFLSPSGLLPDCGHNMTGCLTLLPQAFPPECTVPLKL